MTDRFKFNFNTQLITGFIAALLLLVILTSISYTNNKAYQESSELVARTNVVLYHAQEALTISLGIETGQRGFVITRDSVFLQRYYESVADLPKHINLLFDLTVDNPNQQRRLQLLQALVEQRSFLTSEANPLDKHFSSGQEASIIRKGQAITDKIRGVIAEFQAEEKVLLNQRIKEQASVLQSYNNSSTTLYSVMGIILATLFLLVYKNLRARTQAEIRLRQTSDEIQDLYNNAPCGYLSSNVTGVIVNINDTFLSWLGYERKEVVNVLKFRDLLTEESCELFDMNFTLFKVRGFVTDMQFDLVRKNKTIIHILLNSTAIFDEDGNYLKSRSSLFDISQIKQMEAQLREAKQTAELANHTKGQFLANMSHEIRTPLNAVIGLSHLALKTDLTPKQHDYLKKIQSSGESLLAIVNDILDFSKIESGKMTLEEMDFDLEEVFQKLADVITYKAQAKGLEIAFGIDSKVPTFLTGDPVRIEQILSNLCSNAVKFTDKGEVVVKVHLLEDDQTRIKLQFNVGDTGIGMDKSQIEKLFKPFSQADDSISRKYGGTGLGLSILKRLVELMDGEVFVQSEPGKGSNFSFTICLKKQKIQRKIPAPSVDPRKLTVMVVDDNTSSLKILKGALEYLSFRVVTSGSGIHAIHYLKNNRLTDPVQLVLLDWKMPGMDGLEAARIIRDDPQLASLKIFMMCNSYGHESLFQLTEQLQLSGILTKPIRYSILYDSIMGAIQGEVIRYEKDRKEIMATHPAAKTGHILLVEDNEINQQVASELLQSIGFTLDIANNGEEAIASVKASGYPSKYNLVLMDLQMPVMGGIKATVEIMKLSDYKDLPIIAMTADAIVGVQEKCLKAGMRDFIIKPINPANMLETIERWITRKSKSGEGKISIVKPPTAPAEIPGIRGVDIEAGLANVAGNRKLYLELLHKFLHKHESFIAGIKEAFSTGTDEEAMRSIHTLKGMSGNLGMSALHNACKEVEEALKTRPGPGLDQILRPLETNLEMLSQSLRAGLVNPSENQRPVDPAQISSMIDQLERCLRDNDPEALTIIKEIKVAEGYGKQFSEIEKVLEKYDFERALDFLIQLKTQPKQKSITGK